MSGEALLVSAVLAAGALPLVAWLWRSRRPLARAGIGGAALLWLGGVAWLAPHLERAAVVAETAPGRPLEVRSDGYTSSKACQSCHPDQYASWHASYHRTMTQVASPESIKAPFDGRVIEHASRYRLERRGDEFWVVTDDPRLVDGSAEVERRVVLVTGSHHMQAYWVETGQARKLVDLPLLYRLPEKRWIPATEAFLAPPGAELAAGGLWNRVCLRCHTTHSVPGWGDDFSRMETRVAEFGITCEACHGPAETHAGLNRNPLRRYTAHLGDSGDESVVNPKRLEASRSIEVCGRCHSVHAFPGVEAAFAWSERGMPYRPGEALSQALHVFRHGEDEDAPAVRFMNENFPAFFEERFWPDGQVAVVGRELNDVSESPCFAGGEFTCVSCHSMHKGADDPRSFAEWADDQLAPGMDGDAACLQCHEGFRERPEEHTRHAAASEGSRCMNCHMPHTSYGLLKAARTHWLASPDPAVTLASGRANACNLCHLDQPLDWAAAHLEEWYGTPRPPLDDPDRRAVAEGAYWALRGHAGQRALMAWHMGWEPAQQASGSDWMVPVLIELLMDPYGAVRFIAHRSLLSIPGMTELPYDYLAPAEERQAAAQAFASRWARGPREPAPPGRIGRVPVQAGGMVDTALLDRLLEKRDDQPIVWAE